MSSSVSGTYANKKAYFNEAFFFNTLLSKVVLRWGGEESYRESHYVECKATYVLSLPIGGGYYHNTLIHIFILRMFCFRTRLWSKLEKKGS